MDEEKVEYQTDDTSERVLNLTERVWKLEQATETIGLLVTGLYKRLAKLNE